MAAIRIGDWQWLATGGASTIAMDGDRTAVAGEARLAVWSNDRLLRTVDAPWPSPGRPRFRGTRVFWGPGVLDLDSGAYVALEAARPAIWPGGGERPHAHVWSARGDRLLLSSSTGDRSAPARVVLFDGDTGRAVSALWRGSDPPPIAGWIGRRSIVVGLSDPLVFERSSGAARDRVTLGAGTVARVDADEHEHAVIVVDINRSIASLDPRTWLVVDKWDGRWQDAAIAPDGRLVAGLDLAGTLHFAALVDGRFRPLGDTVAMPDAVSVEVVRGWIGLVGGGGAARATLDVDMAGPTRGA